MPCRADAPQAWGQDARDCEVLEVHVCRGRGKLLAMATTRMDGFYTVYEVMLDQRGFFFGTHELAAHGEKLAFAW